MKKLNLKRTGILIRNNYTVNRSLPLILFSVILIIGCIIGAMAISSVETGYVNRFLPDMIEHYKSVMEETYRGLIGITGVYSGFFVLISIVLPFVLTTSINGFMHDKSANDFYHSLAVTRVEMYVANFVTTFINSAVTIVASQLGGIIFMTLIADYEPLSFGGLLLAQLPVIGTALLYVALFTAIAMISTIASGTHMGSIFNYVFINFYIPATILAVATSGLVLFQTELFEYIEHFPQMFAYTSPFIRYILAVTGTLKFTPLSYVFTAIATVLMIALGIWLYAIKKNENSFKPLPFTPAIRPLQYLVTFDFILLGGTLFYSITLTFVWCIVGILLSLLFSFVLFNSFANKSFNGVLKKAYHMAIILGITIILGVIFVADVFNIYKEPQPILDNINSGYVSVSIDSYDHNEYYSYDFVGERNVYYNSDYEIELTDEAKKDIVDLWKLMEECNSNCETTEKYYSYSQTDSIRITVNIGCKNDFSQYYGYLYSEHNCEHTDELNAIMNKFSEKYNYYYDEYYYEQTEAIKE